MVTAPHETPPRWTLCLPPEFYFRAGIWLLFTARQLLRAGMIGRRGMGAALRCYRALSRLGMAAWRAQKRQFLA